MRDPGATDRAHAAASNLLAAHTLLTTHPLPCAQLGFCKACGAAVIDEQCQAPNTQFRVCSASRASGKTDFLSLSGNTAGCKFQVNEACTKEACPTGTFCVDLTVGGWWEPACVLILGLSRVG